MSPYARRLAAVTTFFFTSFLIAASSVTAEPFVPNDPFFSEQWHLSNSMDYPHVNILPVWERGITGAGVTIGIVDDALEWAHEDIVDAYVASDSWNFADNTSDPSPVLYGDNHGTAVAGVAAARGGNNIGVTGAAPMANLAGLRIDLSEDADESTPAAAIVYNSTGPNPTIHIKNHSYGEVQPYLDQPLVRQAFADSVAAGTIHVVAAGNSRPEHETVRFEELNDADVGKKAMEGYHDVITVAALGADGTFASYSNFGANVFVTAPSDTSNEHPVTEESYPSITTTDRMGEDGYNSGNISEDYENANYTNYFGGTSSAAPLVTGIMALGKEANPDMDVRLAKHALAYTSHVVDADDSTDTSDGGWKTNAAGLQFNQNYGFGLIDADGFVSFVQNHAVSPRITETIDNSSLNMVITESTMSHTFDLTTIGDIENIEVALQIENQFIHNISATLTSPHGTISRLMTDNAGSNDVGDIDWIFTTNTFWGEAAPGIWTLTLENLFVVSEAFQDEFGGYWSGYTIAAHTGSIMLIPEPTSTFMLLSAMMMLTRRRHA